MLEINDEVLEWEILQKTITVDKIAPNINIHRKTVSIIVNRNDSYQIEAILTAIIEVPVRERSDYEYLNRLYMNPLGSPKELFTIEGSDQFGSKIELRNCYIIEHSSTDSESDSETIVTLKIRVQEILIDQNIESKLSWLSEWYINGPVDVDFPGETVRYRDEKSDKTSRKRVTVDILR